MSKIKALLTKHSYWTGAVGLISGIFGVIGTIWAILNTPTAGELTLKHELSTDKELVFSVTNSGGITTALNKIQLEFTNPIKFTHLYKKPVTLYKDKIISQNYQIKNVLRSPHVPTDFPAIGEDGTLYISNASGHLDISPINNSCDAISSNLPCAIEPHSQITIRIPLHGEGKNNLILGHYSSQYDLVSSLKNNGKMHLCAFFDDGQKSCKSDIAFN